MGKYDHIINMPRPVSRNHKQMPLLDRAAQFAPFAALNGYDDAILETARLTDERVDISEEEKEIISAKLGYIVEHKYQEEIKIVYFVPDEKKSGGSYKTHQGIVKRIDEVAKIVVFNDKKTINIEDISALFNDELDRLFNRIF